jgi:hypothetical protein
VGIAFVGYFCREWMFDDDGGDDEIRQRETWSWRLRMLKRRYPMRIRNQRTRGIQDLVKVTRFRCEDKEGADYPSF